MTKPTTIVRYVYARYAAGLAAALASITRRCCPPLLRRGVLGGVLVATLLIPLVGTVAAQDPPTELTPEMQWEFIPADGTGPIRGGEGMTIRNLVADASDQADAPHYLHYAERDYGINLDWTKERKNNFVFVRQPGLDQNGVVESGERVALLVVGVPEQAANDTGYLVYQERKYGINLAWTDQPGYEWTVASFEPSADGELVAGPGSLFNMNPRFETDKNRDGANDVGDYVGYGNRVYGINLWWEYHHSKEDGCDEPIWVDGSEVAAQVLSTAKPEYGPVGEVVVYVVKVVSGDAIVCD